jgi:hypothetical protein
MSVVRAKATGKCGDSAGTSALMGATASNDLRKVKATKAEYINRQDIVTTALPER